MAMLFLGALVYTGNFLYGHREKKKYMHMCTCSLAIEHCITHTFSSKEQGGKAISIILLLLLLAVFVTRYISTHKGSPGAAE